MIVAGLTGSIAMGKIDGRPRCSRRSARRCSTPMRRCANSIARPTPRRSRPPFPAFSVGGEVDREQLAARALGDPAALERLEAIVHPDVARRAPSLPRRAAAQGRRVAVVDVPLLFETRRRASRSTSSSSSAPASAQRARALARPGMSASKSSRRSSPARRPTARSVAAPIASSTRAATHRADARAGRRPAARARRRARREAGADA